MTIFLSVLALSPPGETTTMPTTTQPRKTNRLARSTSPYLLQHAQNPVDWYEWGAEAFEKARREDKPIFLSIGYSACHWCHVMEHESFEDDDVAAVLNEHFVSIKVDREQRPDVDEIYMQATLMFTGGHGGWPMSVFLTPDRRPFFGGTYFPKRQFVGLLKQIADYWSNKRDELLTDASTVAGHLREWASENKAADAPITREMIDRSCDAITRTFDEVHGGVLSGSTNKFPPSMAMQLMMRRHARTGKDSGSSSTAGTGIPSGSPTAAGTDSRTGKDSGPSGAAGTGIPSGSPTAAGTGIPSGSPTAAGTGIPSGSRYLDPVVLTLTKMAYGGIYDHLGGGICRYSTDTEWLVPHFEKMLYDQALVSDAYLDAYQLTGTQLFADTARSILDYVIADLQSPEGGYYSTRDADSEGLEGKFYVWTLDEVLHILGPDDGKLFAAYYDVTETGNWDERFGHAQPGPKNILRVLKPPDLFAKLHDLDLAEWQKKLAAMRAKMLEVRSQRVPPGLDDKVLTAWNGLMIGPMARAASIFNEPKYRDSAIRAADFVLRELRTPPPAATERTGEDSGSSREARTGIPSGSPTDSETPASEIGNRKSEIGNPPRLLRNHRRGVSELAAYLEDYAFMISGLLELYEATFDRRWLDEARGLTETCIEHYFDESDGGFFFTADDHEELIVRTKNPIDNAIPSGNSVMAFNLIRLSVHFDRKDYLGKSDSIFRAFQARATRYPGAYDKLLAAADMRLSQIKEIALIGPIDSPDMQALRNVVFGRYLPNKVVTGAPSALADLPLLANRQTIHGKPTAYVCEHYVCKRPVTTPDELARVLD